MRRASSRGISTDSSRSLLKYDERALLTSLSCYCSCSDFRNSTIGSKSRSKTKSKRTRVFQQTPRAPITFSQPYTDLQTPSQSAAHERQSIVPADRADSGNIPACLRQEA